MTRNKKIGVLALVAFTACVWGANWLTTRHGMVSVGFGLTATAGTWVAGLTFGLRDAVHETLGRRWVLAGITVGAWLAYLLGASVNLGGSVTLALASATAFGLSELADFAVYSPLRERSWPGAVVASGVVGAAVDTWLFLWLAFGAAGGRDVAGQMVGKTVMVVPALLIVWAIRRR